MVILHGQQALRVYMWNMSSYGNTWTYQKEI